MSNTIKINSEAESQKNVWMVFYLLILTNIVFRALVLIHFSFQYTDSDQAVMWYGLDMYAQGIFPEPRFLGQAYNTMLEALFAVPLYKTGIPAYIALPIISSLMALLPFALISGIILKKTNSKIALLILSIPLLLPIEYSLITSLPRGFVTGIFFSSLGALGMFYPKSNKLFFIGSFLAVIGFSINPNSVILSIFYLFYYFLENFKDKKFYIYSLLGALSGFIIHLGVNYFYKIHPNYNLHKEWKLKFSINHLISSSAHIDKYLNDLVPFLKGNGFILIILFFVIGIYLLKLKKYKESIVLFSIPVLFLLTLGINKTTDAIDSVYFSYSRMYLSLPIVLGLSLYFFHDLPWKKYMNYFLCIPFLYFIFHSIKLPENITNNVHGKPFHIVIVSKVTDLKQKCDWIKQTSKENNIDLIIFSNLNQQDLLNYACPSCDAGFPKTLRPEYERRTWRMIEDEKTIYSSVLVLRDNFEIPKTANTSTQIANNDFKIIKNNRLYTMDLLDSLGIKYRSFK